MLRKSLFIFVCFLLSISSFAEKKKVWIDTDIIFDKFGKDVDDGLALILAFQHPDIEIVGISLIHNVKHGQEVTRKLIKYYAQYDIPVYSGSDDASLSYGNKTVAVEALANALRKDMLTILALGPATNIANLLKFYPETISNIDNIVFCAGRSENYEFRPKNAKKALPDYNFEIDSASFKYILSSGKFPVTLAGFEAAEPIYLFKEDIKKLKKRDKAGDKWVARQLRNWIFGWRIALNVKGFIPFDLATVGVILYPEYFTVIKANAKIIYRENDSKFLIKTDKKSYLEVYTDGKKEYDLQFVSKTKNDFRDLIIEKIFN
jgi:pyrimidine-specific ribonucleoside hydrolase